MKKFNFDKNKKSFILSLLLLAVVVGTAGTVALAVAKSNGVINTFQAADNNTGIDAVSYTHLQQNEPEIPGRRGD